MTGGGSIGKSHFKEGSLSSPTVHTDTSVVIIYNGFRDGEAKPGVAGTSYPSLIHPVKALKNMREINLFDPRSIVSDVKLTSWSRSLTGGRFAGCPGNHSDNRRRAA